MQHHPVKAGLDIDIPGSRDSSLCSWHIRALSGQSGRFVQKSVLRPTYFSSINHDGWILVDTGGVFQAYESYDGYIFTPRYVMMIPIDFWMFIYSDGLKLPDLTVHGNSWAMAAR